MAVPIKLDLELDLSDIKKQGQAIGNILERAMNKNTRTRVLDSLERQIATTREKLQKMEHEIADIFSNPSGNFKYFSDEFANAYQESRKLESSVERIVSKARELPELANASISEVAEFLEKNMSRTIGARRKAGKGEVTGRSSEVQQEINMLKQYSQYMKQIEDEFQNFKGSEQFESMGIAIEETKERLQRLIEEYRRASFESGNSIQNAVQPMVNFNNEIRSTMSSLQQAFGPYIQAATMAVHALAEALNLVLKGLKAIGTAAVGAFKPLLSIAQGAAKAVGKMFDSIKKHNETTMKNLWRNVLRYGIGVRSMYFLIRKIRNEIGDVINELSKQIPEVNAQMSAFKTAVNGLKGALATAFQPILSAVLPALTKLINALSRAVALIGKFIALLTGQNYVYAATATQVDYAASLDKTGKSAKKAKKELEGYLSPIDEINKYQSKKDNDSDSGGGAGGGSPYTLKKVPIEDWIKDLWDKIRKAWQTADFFELGKMIGDKLAKMLATIPWNKIKNEARRLGKSLATLLNGIMYGEFDGKSLGYWIGHTLAQAINTGFEFLNQFVKHFDWKKLGQTIVDFIKGIFENLDWNVITETLGGLGKGIGETIAKIFESPEIFAEAGDALGRLVNALVDMIYNFFNQQSGHNIGLAIANFINGAVEQFDAKDFANMCNTIMTTLLDSLISSIQNTKWDEVGAKLAQVLNGIDFKSIFSKYASLASNIIDAILDLLESFLDTLSPDKVTEIGESIANAINGINWQPQRFGSLMNRLFQALLDIAATAVNNVNWDKIGEDVRAALQEIRWKEIISKASGILSGIGEGLKEALLGSLQGIFGDIGGDIVYGLLFGIKGAITRLLTSFLGPFMILINAVKDLFGIHSPSTVFMEIGTNIVQGFINGIQTIVAKAQEIWNRLKTITIEVYTAIKLKIVEIITTIQNSISEKLEAIKSTWTSVWESVKTTTVSIFEGIWSAIKGIINSILGGIESMVNGIIKGINFAADALNTLQIDPPEWIKSKYGIGTIGFNIPTLSTVSLPRLAQGAVIPPNRQFMAVLGDQKQGTNIETPLSTMVEAFNTALRSSDVGGVKQINFLLPDRRTLAQYTIAGGKIIQTSTGKNPFELA